MEATAPTGIVGWITIVITLIYLEGILSIDNAAVLGAMVAPLPPDQPVPWPRPLRFLDGITWRVLGGQRLAALKVGLLGAYVGRGSMLFVATYIVQNPWLRLLGALYLIKLAAEHLAEERHRPSDAHEGTTRAVAPPRARSFWSVVAAVELADLAFSIDNVVAAIALSRDMRVILLGVGLGIVTMRFAAGIFTRLILRYPVLGIAAYLLVFNIGVELLIEEYLHVHFSEIVTFAISATTIAAALAYERIPAARAIGTRLRVVRYLFVAIDAAFRVILWPFGALLRLIVAAFRRGRPSEAEARASE